MARRSSVLALFAAACALLTSVCSACGTTPPLAPPAAPLTPPTMLCTEARPSQPCNRAEEIEAMLQDPRLTIVGSAPTPGGRQDAKLLTLALPRDGGKTVLRAKWRPLSSESLTNDPRKELGAYAVEKLFLEPHEYIVPPTTGHCFARDDYRAVVDKSAAPSFGEQGALCIFGILSYWLENVAKPESAREDGTWSADHILDEGLFNKNGVYRQSIADLNLLTYLIRHGDAHDQQFLITKDRQRPRVYSVDNSIAFQSIKNPMLFFRQDWSTIQVPAVSKRSVARLQSLSEDEWARLAVIEQYVKRGTALVQAPPGDVIGPPDSGLRWVGLGLQIGLTEGEIAGVRSRLAGLVDEIESHNVRTF
jgi:hypothetical protein